MQRHAIHCAVPQCASIPPCLFEVETSNMPRIGSPCPHTSHRRIRLNDGCRTAEVDLHDPVMLCPGAHIKLLRNSWYLGKLGHIIETNLGLRFLRGGK